MNTKHVDQLFTCFTILVFGGCMCLVGRVVTVRIRELRVPAVARHGAAVVLDCDYILDGPEDHEGLVVKWYLNDQFRPVYQWIPGGGGGPKELGVLRGRLNLEYRASQDARTEHRALHISAPAPDLAGEYTCVVSTFKGEDRQSKSMLVYVPEKNLRLRQGQSPEGVRSVVCSAEGVYPEPEMTIRMALDCKKWKVWLCRNMTREISGTPVLRREGETGLYDISVVAPLPEEIQDTPVCLPIVFTCELNVPRANNYTVRKEFVYYPGSAGKSVSAVTWIVLTMSASLLLCY